MIEEELMYVDQGDLERLVHDSESDELGLHTLSDILPQQFYSEEYESEHSASEAD